jgi:hypothetical protein
MEQTFVNALLSGDPKVIGGATAALVLTHFGAWVLKQLALGFTQGLDALAARWSNYKLGRITEIGDRLIKKAKAAVNNQVLLSASIAEAIADGKVTAEEWGKMAEAAWTDFKDGMDVHDWADFGALLIPGYSRAATGKAEIEAAVRARFLVAAKSLAHEAAERSCTMRLQRKILQTPPQDVPFTYRAAVPGNMSNVVLTNVQGDSLGNS